MNRRAKNCTTSERNVTGEQWPASTLDYYAQNSAVVWPSCSYYVRRLVSVSVPLAMLSLVLATVLGPTADQIYNLWNATGKYCLRTNMCHYIRYPSGGVSGAFKGGVGNCSIAPRSLGGAG